MAPPHISSEKQSLSTSAMPSAPLTMSRVRIRVESSDWCASLMVVSVMSSFFCSSTHLEKASGPLVSSRCLRPISGVISRVASG